MAKNFITHFRGESYSPQRTIKDEPRSPPEDFPDLGSLENYFNAQCFNEEYSSGMKKSMSMGDINALRNYISDSGSSRRTNQNSCSDLSKRKYVSTAEAIYHYHRDTPERFHSSKPRNFQQQYINGLPTRTVPQSPMLRTKARTRTMHIMSQQEKEEKELEEIRKHKIKANPIPRGIIEGLRNLPDVQRKPNTVFEPFHLTEQPKKIAPVIETPPPKFKARPAPKDILEEARVPPKLPVHVTSPHTPNFRYKPVHKPPVADLNDNNKVKPVKKPSGPVKPEPFSASFERRNDDLLHKKEVKVKQIIDDEKKQASQFKAHPVPPAVKKQMRMVTGKSSSSTTSSENKENNFKFEAKPPTVLFKTPFKPVLQSGQIVKQKPFHLYSEKRAVEREKFDQHIKEKEIEQEMLRKQREKEIQEAEEQAKAELRAKMVHHAKPVPTVINKPFIPQKAPESTITVPETPKFVRRLKQQNLS